MKHKLFFIWLLIGYCLLPIAYCFSQDIHFTQFTQTPLTINPAQAGTAAHIRRAIGYRSQWGGMEITLCFLNPSPFLFSQASFSK